MCKHFSLSILSVRLLLMPLSLDLGEILETVHSFWTINVFGYTDGCTVLIDYPNP
jgi:hypothetical protein